MPVSSGRLPHGGSVRPPRLEFHLLVRVVEQADADGAQLKFFESLRIWPRMWTGLRLKWQCDTLLRKSNWRERRCSSRQQRTFSTATEPAQLVSSTSKSLCSKLIPSDRATITPEAFCP